MTSTETMDKITRDQNHVSQQCNELASLFAEQMCAILPEADFVFESKKQKQKKIQYEIAQNFLEIQKRLTTGMKALFQEYVEHTQNLSKDQALEKVSRLFSFLKGKDKVSFDEEFAQGKKLQEILNISVEDFELLYQAAKRLLENKIFDVAADAFLFLTMLAPDSYAIWMGYAVSEDNCNRKERALNGYAYVAYLNPFDPMSYIYSSKCFESLGDIENARSSLEIALVAIKDEEGQEKVKEYIHNEIIRIKRGSHL